MTKSADPQDVERFQALITARTGLVFDDNMKPLLGEMLEDRMCVKHARTAADYLRELATSRREAMELMGPLTVSETYFLRNSDQFRVVESWLRSNTRRSQSPRRLRILSAGCSSGEEPYSLAMVLCESLPDIAEWDVSIYGVDISSSNLAKARAARYSAWSLRETPADLRQRYFQMQGRQFVLDGAVRSMVEFEQHNLLDADASFWQPDRYDLVFCRNVLMYLSLDAARAVVANIGRSMASRGLLFLGHAENLRGISQDFHLRHTHGTFYYGRSGSDDLKVPLDRDELKPAAQDGSTTWRTWFESIEQSSAKIADIANRAVYRVPKPAITSTEAQRSTGISHSLASAIELSGNERFSEALELLASLPPSSADDADALLVKAMLLTSGGDPAAAQAVCARLLEVDGFNAGAHYIMALCREHAGDIAAAIGHDRTAAHLDAGFAMPHLHLGLLLRRDGDVLAARRELKTAVGLLAREDSARIVLFSGGFGREGLIELCRGELNACAPVA